ncbi:hypothetical protein BJ741DRAFT_580565 [Chytriomyces cf. hyalinus JEL632]|nr:hypothetical protein BJ741DRAFT_580565 [Chytriomyces cf. hyalinus JEL632]
MLGLQDGTQFLRNRVAHTERNDLRLRRDCFESAVPLRDKGRPVVSAWVKARFLLVKEATAAGEFLCILLIWSLTVHEQKHDCSDGRLAGDTAPSDHYWYRMLQMSAAGDPAERDETRGNTEYWAWVEVVLTGIFRHGLRLRSPTLWIMPGRIPSFRLLQRY